MPAVRDTRSFGDKAADAIAYWGGTWRFVLGLLLGMNAWCAFNYFAAKPIDPFPYILLNLALSTLAAIQAPIILMAQRRADAKRDRRDNAEYRLVVLAEDQLRRVAAELDVKPESGGSGGGYL